MVISKMKKIIILMMLVLSFSSQSAAHVFYNKKYIPLLLQCRAIRKRILQQNNFEIIRQKAQQDFQTTMSGIAERFTAGIKRPSNFEKKLGAAGAGLKINLDALEVSHNYQVRTLIIQTVSSYLYTLNTQTSRNLLAELIANGFNF
jgi:hypothetical protein